MFGNKFKVSKELYEKVKAAAKVRNAASLNEFVEMVLEREADKVLTEAQKSKTAISDKEVENIANKLKGLGYLE